MQYRISITEIGRELERLGQCGPEHKETQVFRMIVDTEFSKIVEITAGITLALHEKPAPEQSAPDRSGVELINLIERELDAKFHCDYDGCNRNTAVIIAGEITESNSEAQS